MRMKKALAELIHRERISRVATANEAGMPHLVPVCHVVEDGKIYFASGTDGRKILNLKANPARGGDGGPVLRGLGAPQGRDGAGARRRSSTKGPRFRKVRALLYAKYPQYPTDAALDESDSVIVEVTPSRVFSWGMK